MKFTYFFNHTDYIAQGQDIKCYAQSGKGWIAQKASTDTSFRPEYELAEYWALKRAKDNNLSQATITRLEKAYEIALKKYGF